ncbi:methyl-accepting chemotaxis protein [Calothrix sp. PCC 7507]|uniref:methyl-accepting chemotaxis protein n=1 Tax=Calothrix sp. PCC 7507 TaxID=99598 RepID=UPI00029EF72B|nr:methyl-accepting chemotaxis protein [Calothrix sp. PCC 7507]AFY34047.1 methyl-accepting chemotaxis sensory transducer with Cache sensor [Calothrix sp. PCC 7507]
MFNKTDTANSSNARNRASIISSEKATDNVVQLPLESINETVNNSPLNQAVAYVRRLHLGTKATVLAIAIGTLPALGIGAIAYKFASRSITQQVTQAQETEAVNLTEQINRFMFERYGDIQVLSNLPFLVNSEVNKITPIKEKQAVLDRIVETSKVYDSIAIVDINGNPLVTTSKENVSNLKDRDYFQTALQKNSAIITQPEISKTTGILSIYTAAPIKDSVTGQTIAVVRARMPVKSLEDVLKNYSANAHEYHLIDKSGKFFAATEKNQVGRNAQKDFPGLDKLQSAKKIDSIITIDQIDKQPQLISYVPSRKLEGLPDLKWDVVIATDTAIILAPQRQLFWTIAIGTALTALIVAAIAAWLAKRATEPILSATEAVSKLGQGQLNTRLEIQTEDELGDLAVNINQMADQLQVLLKEQEQDTERAKLLADITLRIRKNLKTEDIYKTAVREVRQALKTDRVIVYELNPETWQGIVVAESIAGIWPKMHGVKIDDPCFRERHVENYKEGRVRAIANIYQEPSLVNNSCYIQMLEKFAVKGNLIAPIITDSNLHGLLIAHHCESPRVWQQQEIDLLQQTAIQISYALEQAQLLEELEKAKALAQQDSEEERGQKETLQMQLLELLSDVEGAARGDLTVRADVTAGEIGTVADFFNSIVESLRDIVTQVKQAATQVNTAVGSNEGAIRQLAEEAIAQTAEINRTLDAVDQMTDSIKAVAENAQQAAVIANHAAHTATKSGQAMDLTVQNILLLRETVGETAKKVKRLGESSQQISRVVSLINQIAMQTNLLAINAGIEAARAGDEGQGFAIVAEEVGELAARSAAATKEIEQIVENIQRETSEVVQAMEVGTSQVVEGTRIVEDAKQSLSQILDVSRQIDYLVQTISTATASQVETSESVSELMKAIAALSQRTSDSSRLVSESLQQTVDISQELQETVGTFKVS